MGCSQSKLDDEEAVQICKDRRRLIKQAVEQRTRFASGHIAYIQSLKRVSDALREYIEGDEPHEFSLDSYVTPVKKPSPGGFITISPTSITPPKLIHAKPRSTLKVNYLMASGSRAVAVEERPPMSPEIHRVETYSPSHQYGMDGFFGMNMNSSSFWNPMNSPEHRPSSYNFPPPSPQNSQWDFFWNPFSSLDYYGYTNNRNSLDPRASTDDEIVGLRRVREEEGIPELEEDEPDENQGFVNHSVNATTQERGKFNKMNCCAEEEVTVEDVDEDEEDEEDEDAETTGSECETDNDDDEGDGKCQCNQEPRKFEVSRLKVETTGPVVGVGNQEMKKVGDRDDPKKETPGYTVYVNRRPTSMAEVIKDLEDQFATICKAAKEVSVLLEASRAQYSSSSSNELTPMKMLNPVALFRSGSSRSSSSRFLISSSAGSKENGYDSCSDLSDESCMLSGSHQSTLDRLYAWEKKLYDEVRSGERVRMAYEKKCLQLRNQDVKGDDPSSVDKTRTVIRDLHTQIKVSIHSIEAISKRIETLRDQELQPQLLELVHGLARMWKVMAECHQIQKRTLDEAKLLLAGTPSKRHKKRHSSLPETNPQRLARSALHLEAELRNLRASFEIWITSQRLYMQALAGWLLRCFRCDPDPEKVKLSFCPHPIYRTCIQWSRLLNGLNEKPVLDGLDFFAAGMGSVYAQQLKDDPNRVGTRKYGSGSDTGMAIMEVGKVEDVMTAEKMAEVAIRVLCAGMSVAVSSLTEFAIGSAEEYTKLISQPENDTFACGSQQAGGVN